jgi:hypothetical protein
MPPKKNYSKKDILNAGMEIVREAGFSFISARNIAKKISSSQIPIYSNYSSIDEVKIEVRNSFRDLMYKFMENDYTENKVLNAAIGVCIFAREEKKAFEELFFTDENIKENIKEFVGEVYKKFEKEDRFKRVTPEALNELLIDMWIYTHGLAVIINRNLIENISDEEITKRIFKVSQIIIKEKSKGENDGQEI